MGRNLVFAIALDTGFALLAITIIDKAESHVVCAWIGNSQKVAAKHYLQVTDDHFEKASRARFATSMAPQRVANETSDAMEHAQNSMFSHDVANPVGDEGLEVVQETSGNEALAIEGNVKCNALADDFSAIDSNLQSLIRAWPSLSESVRKEILTHLPSPSSRQERQTQEG